MLEQGGRGRGEGSLEGQAGASRTWETIVRSLAFVLGTLGCTYF